MSLVFNVEPLRTSWNEMIELASQHWKETENYRHNQTFCPSFERYNQYDESGWLLHFTARHEGRMVGYAIMYVVPSMHTQQLIATEDTWFLLPEHRKGRNAIEFYKFVESVCRTRGVVEIGMTAKLTNGAGRILEYLGYKIVSQQYSKHLSYNEDARQHGQPSLRGCADSAIADNVMELSDDIQYQQKSDSALSKV